jgi:hypothetical protein
MAGRKHHRRRNPRVRRHHHHHARRHNRAMRYFARNRNPFRRVHRHHRRRNPSFLNSEIMGLSGGAIVAGLGARIIPQMVASQYNVSWTGYAIDAATGFLISRFGLRMINRNWEMGGYVGTVLSVVSRIVSEKFGGSMFTQGLGDTDFDMGYYMGDSFPWRGSSSQGPYPQFPGGRYALPAPTPTAATAVQAGQAAAAAIQQAAAPAAGAVPGMGGGGWRGSARYH